MASYNVFNFENSDGTQTNFKALLSSITDNNSLDIYNGNDSSNCSLFFI